MNPDFADILSALSAAGVEFLIVGAHALAAHGVPRATGDLDIWIRPTPDNAARTLRALAAFGAPLSDLSIEDLTRPDTVFQMGVPPARIDILSGITGVDFADAWDRRVTVRLAEGEVAVLSKADFIANKAAVGRPKDLADMALLDEARRPRALNGTPLTVSLPNRSSLAARTTAHRSPARAAGRVAGARARRTWRGAR